MRKILSAEEIEKRKKRNTLLISIFLLAVLVFGTAGYGLLSGQRTSTNNENTDGNSLNNVGNYWTATLNGNTLYFSISPDAVKDIPVDISLDLQDYVGKPLYIASENNAVNNEIASTLGKYTSRTQLACYGSCEKDLPEKDCSENLIVWADSSENKVSQEDQCIFIDGDLKAVDAFLYKVFRL